MPEDRRVALVTGADTGIGFAIARRLRRDDFALGFAPASATTTRGRRSSGSARARSNG